MKSEIFNARLLQISIERDHIMQKIVLMDKYNELSPDYVRYDFEHYEKAQQELESLSRGIDNLVSEYQEGVASPAPLKTRAQVQAEVDGTGNEKPSSRENAERSFQ